MYPFDDVCGISTRHFLQRIRYVISLLYFLNLSRLIPFQLATVDFFLFVRFSTTNVQITTAIKGVKELLELSSDDIQVCIDAYEYLQNGTRDTSTEVEIDTISRILQSLASSSRDRGYRKDVHSSDDRSKQGLYGNQLLH